jgi:WXXGXW repeat (2 copies)
LGSAAFWRLRLGRRPLGRLTMVRLHPVRLALPALVVLFGCGRSESPPRTTQIIDQPPAQLAQATAVIAPGPPPPPQSELVPPPAIGTGPVVWQPGHWLLSGNNWVWRPGQYVPPPPGQTTWVQGQWFQQPGGRWTWLEGHWA